MGDQRLVRWQALTLGTLFVGYAGYYVCRSNLSVVTPLLLDEYGGQGITEADIGVVASVGVALYAVGKFANGVLTDFVGGRALFLGGMAVSVLCTVLFGLAGGLAAFTLLWAVNRYVQSMGWVALVKIASRWFPLRWHASVMGALSMSYLLGDALARLYLGRFIEAGLSWRGVFFVAAATLGGIALVGCLTLRSSPTEIGRPEPAANPDSVFGTDGASARPASLGTLLRPFLSNLTFWVVCLMNVGLTLIRETFNFWTPTYLCQAAGLDPGDAAQASLIFPLVGAAAALGSGLLSDRLQGRHGRIMVPSLVLLVGALWLIGQIDVSGRPALALVLIGCVSGFLMAPYAFCSGVLALDLGGKHGSSTAVGLIDSAGYLGAIFSGYGIGKVARTHGWTTAFHLLAGAAALTLGTAALYWLRQELRPGRRQLPSARKEVPS